MWKCPKCDTANEGTVCWRCGTKADLSRNKEKKERKGKKKSKIPWKAINIILSILLVVVLAVLGVNTYFQGQKKELDAVVNEAQQLLDRKEYDACLGKLEAVKSNAYYNRSAQALSTEGMAHMEKENYAQAIACFSAASDIEADSNVLLNLAVCYARSGDMAKAKETLERVQGNEDARTYISAEIAAAEERFEDAVASFENVISTTSDESLKKRAYISLAQLYKEKRHEDKTDYYYLNMQIDIMEEAVRELKTEDDLTLTEMMGEAYFTSKEYDLAIQKFSRLLELGYNRAYIYRNMAIIYQQTGDLSSAEGILMDMRERYPEDYTCYMQLAFVYLDVEATKPQSERDYEKVEENYRLAQRYVPSRDAGELAQLERAIDQLYENGWL